MKKILIALSLILSLTVAGAQPKTAADAQKAVDKAKAASVDAKKSLKSSTWVNLAKAYIDAYEQPGKNLLTGSSQMDVKLFNKDQQILGTSEKKGAEGSYTVDSYADKDLYYNENGLLEFWLVTKPAVEGDLLGEAQKAIAKAAELGAKPADMAEMMEKVHGLISNEALSEYLAGNFAKSSDLFKKTAECYANPILGKTDSLNLYYTAMVSNMAGNKDQAIEFYKKCIATNFFQDGNTFSNLAEIYKQAGDMETCKATLEEGFAKYPQSQGVLVGLINLYRESGEDTQKLFDLLHKAQENEPNNASLFSVEGDIYKQLGDVENAVKCYQKSVEVNPNYVFGELGQGMLFYDQAVKIQEAAAEEYDDNKYMALMTDMETTLEKAIIPFEKAFAMTEDADIKGAVAEYLKNIYFRLREKNENYMPLFEKYKGFLENK